MPAYDQNTPNNILRRSHPYLFNGKGPIRSQASMVASRAAGKLRRRMFLSALAPACEPAAAQHSYNYEGPEIVSTKTLVSAVEVPAKAQFRLCVTLGRGIVYWHPLSPIIVARSPLSLPSISAPPPPSTPPSDPSNDELWEMFCTDPSPSTLSH
ncbi:hypothetical protein DFS34DRAFT_250211 [Phlyctochytrium arcticum]|nr:hypothetical protein DFS34DRAFT_250211 [Phlyctochytrium arcticum]